MPIFLNGKRYDIAGLSQADIQNRSSIILRGASSITVKLLGYGQIHDSLGRIISLDPDYEQSYTYSDTDVLLIVCGTLKCLNVCNNNLSYIEFNNGVHIEDLLCYNNSFVSIDISNIVNLHRLHIYGNPICDNSIYEPNLRQLLYSLPNRSTTSYGSVVIYDWVPMPQWICEYNGGYSRYPGRIKIDDAKALAESPTLFSYNIGATSSSTKWSPQRASLDESSDIPVYTKAKYQLTEGRYYRLHDLSDPDVFGYNNDDVFVYHNGQLVEETDSIHLTRYNELVRLRRSIEYDMLNKHWAFGSAAPNHPEVLSLCDWPLAEYGVFDMWESGEHGLGHSIGMVDIFPGIFRGINDGNVSAVLGLTGNTEWYGTDPVDADGNDVPFENLLHDVSLSSSYHGDACASIIFSGGRTDGERISPASEACGVLLSYQATGYDSSGNPVIKQLSVETSPTILWRMFAILAKTSSIMSTSISFRIMSSNEIGSAYTACQQALWFRSDPNEGDSSLVTTDSGIEYSTNVMIPEESNIGVVSIDCQRYPAPFSPTRHGSLLEDDRDAYRTTGFGHNVMVWDSYRTMYRRGQGDSFATPYSAAIAANLINIWKKQNKINNFHIGFDSDIGTQLQKFLKDVSNPCIGVLQDAVGYGVFDIMNDYCKVNDTLLTDYTAYPQVTPQLQEPSMIRCVPKSSTQYNQPYVIGVYQNKEYDVVSNAVSEGYVVPSEQKEDEFTICFRIDNFMDYVASLTASGDTFSQPIFKCTLNADTTKSVYVVIRGISSGINISCFDDVDNPSASKYAYGHVISTGNRIFKAYPNQRPIVFGAQYKQNVISFFINGIYTASFKVEGGLSNPQVVDSGHVLEQVGKHLSPLDIINLSTYVSHK